MNTNPDYRYPSTMAELTGKPEPSTQVAQQDRSPAPVAEPTPWQTEYENDTGSTDESFAQWWTVTNREVSFKCNAEEECGLVGQSERLESHHQSRRWRCRPRRHRTRRREAMNIKTTFIYPPIPNRNFDWSAVFDDSYDGALDGDNRSHVGFGPTEESAKADLIENYDP